MKPSAPITNRKIRFALVGCGRISTHHIGALQAHADEAELVDICDIESKALNAASQLVKAQTHGRLTDLLKKTTADVIVLTTPSGLHASQAIQSLESGFHVISEKPMATRWEDGLKMVKVAQQSDKCLFVVKQNRHNATLRLLKRAVDEGRFGHIFMVNVNVFWCRPQSYYDLANWRGTWALDGGAFMNQASHYIDLLQWIVGPVKSLQAYTKTLARNIEAEDTGVVNIEWHNGALGSANVTMLTYQKNFEGSITIIGEKGTVRIGGIAVNEVQHWAFAEAHPMDAHIHGSSYETTSVYGLGHPLYYDNVIKVLRGEDIAHTDGHEGLKSLELLTAIYRSSEADGQRIYLPLPR